MKKSLVCLIVLLCLLVPAVLLAAPPPPDAGGGRTGGGSPEPLSAILLAIGVVPTYLVYRRYRKAAGTRENLSQ